MDIYEQLYIKDSFLIEMKIIDEKELLLTFQYPNAKIKWGWMNDTLHFASLN